VEGCGTGGELGCRLTSAYPTAEGVLRQAKMLALPFRLRISEKKIDFFFSCL
jgi:hypothetical protein